MNGLLSFALLLWQVLRLPRPADLTLDERLAAFPRRELPLARPVTIHWDEHQVPFIEADSDADLAVALGLVHAHLRLGQMEVLRRVSRGRLAEMLGPMAIETDRLLRIVDFGKAVPAMLEALPPETRQWLEGFIAGVNHYLFAAERLPQEFRLFALRREAWTPADVLTLARLVAADVTWSVWFRLLRLRDRADWPSLWQGLHDAEISPGVEPGGTWSDRILGTVLNGVSRSGSNALATGPALNASPSPLLAADPHLPIALPNPWLIAAYHSPGHHAAGLMLPGLPVVSLGRNPWIAWAGTNLHAASSDLVELSDLSQTAIIERDETIAVRWARPRRVTLRDTPFGPMVSDSPLLRWRRPGALALRWMGHRPSDEFSAMLALNRARDWPQFRDALDGMGIPGLTMIYADRAGHIGQAAAAHLPARPAGAGAEMLARPEDGAAWDRPLRSADLPWCYDPPEGMVVSANDRTDAGAFAIGFFFAPDDRLRRLRALVQAHRPMSAEGLRILQSDVAHEPALRRRDWLLQLLPPAAALGHGRTRSLAEALARWDGHYGADSAGALAFEVLSCRLARRLCGRRLRAYAATWRTRQIVDAELARLPRAMVAAALQDSLPGAARVFFRFRRWGAMHRLQLAHPLAALPIAGRRLRWAEAPAHGSSETVMKTAHPLGDRRHAATYGSTARLICNLADPDDTLAVLLGGQDGWMGSTTSLDQWPLWQGNNHIRLPLRPETARRHWARHMTLMPG